MDVTGPTQMAILTTMMSQQVQQMAEIQKMIAETTVKLAEMSSDPNLGQYINIRAWFVLPVSIPSIPYQYGLFIQ